MSITPNIPKIPDLSAGEDFNFLYQKGIELIQELNGQSWTDHNLHDPGITLLEIFCYSLTEITQQAGFNIENIIQSDINSTNQTFFAPEDVLTSNPVTIEDYRKILIDTAGLRNGWIVPVPVGGGNFYNGLYDLLLEYEEHPSLGDLNSSIIVRDFVIDFGMDDFRAYTIEVTFPYWDEASVAGFQEEVTITSINSPGQTTVVLTSINDSDDQNHYFTELEVVHNGVSPSTFSIGIRVNPSIGADPTENAQVKTKIIDLLSDFGDSSILKVYNRKVVTAFAIKNQIQGQILSNRNLCEDIRNIKAVRVQEIGINLKIEILNSINIERFLAKLIFELEHFFRPPIQFSNLEELAELNTSLEDIYEGPLLKNGFLATDFFQNLERGQFINIHVSDLVNLILEQELSNVNRISTAIENPGIAISSITISNFIRNKKVATAADCLLLVKSELYKPRFSLNKSSIQFTRNGLTIVYNSALIQSIYQELIQSSISTKVPSASMISKPIETPFSFADHYSIQNDFPAVYGLGNNSLSDFYPTKQKGKVEQFRGYLTLLDHLLASYQGQLANINQLFSISPTITNTYFKQSLYDTPYLERILVDFLNSSDDWKTWTANSNNSYESALEEIYESIPVFIERRNRFLNHLLSRFGLSLSRYTEWRFEDIGQNIINPGALDLMEQEVAYDLIVDKAYILRNLPSLSSRRFLAFNYTEPSWSAVDTTGISQRILTFLGFRNLTRRTFYDEKSNFILIEEGPIGIFSFAILDNDGNRLLESAATFLNAALAEEEATTIIKNGNERTNYHIQEQLVGNIIEYRVSFQENDALLPVLTATHPIQIKKEFDARIAIRQIIRSIREIGCGIYVIEHILLRPKEGDTENLLINNSGSDEFIAEPYSMYVTIIFPSGFAKDFEDANASLIPDIPAIFQKTNFRNYAKDLLAQEIPAHLIYKVFWLDRNTNIDKPETPSINNFSAKWKAWLEAKELNTPGLSAARKELIDTLNEIYKLKQV